MKIRGVRVANGHQSGLSHLGGLVRVGLAAAFQGPPRSASRARVSALPGTRPAAQGPSGLAAFLRPPPQLPAAPRVGVIPSTPTTASPRAPRPSPHACGHLAGPGPAPRPCPGPRPAAAPQALCYPGQRPAPHGPGRAAARPQVALLRRLPPAVGPARREEGSEAAARFFAGPEFAGIYPSLKKPRDPKGPWGTP